MSRILAISAAVAIAASPTPGSAGPKKLDETCPKISIAVDASLVMRPPGAGEAVPCGPQTALAATIPGYPLRLFVNGVDETGGARGARGFPVGLAVMRVVLPGEWVVADVVPPTAFARVIALKETGDGDNTTSLFVTEVRAHFPRRDRRDDPGTEKTPWHLVEEGSKATVGAPQRNLALTLWPLGKAPATVGVTVSVSDFRGNTVAQPLKLTVGR